VAIADLLETIVAAARHAVEARARMTPRDQLAASASRQPQGRRFREALRTGPAPRVIAECKRRSPSRGILRRNYDPAAHARAYVAAGAAAISVLTEPTFFDGCLDHLAAVRRAVDVPLLRKDFVVDEYQLAEAIACGADAVLLIVGALDDRALARLLASATGAGLAALVEVHDRDELARALAAGADLIGVNSRNLRTLTVDPAVLETVAAGLPAGVTAVAESGIRSADDIDRLSAIGYHAFLVGERLMVEENPGTALNTLRGASASEPRERSEPAERRTSERVGESEERSPSGKR
jgi:indole-3-glycerol phosphate synthase